jgi:flagellar hook-associated protein 1 FlgK
MPGDLFVALRSAQSGLIAHQGALDSVAQNVANVNTPGYTRKAASLESRTLAGAGAGVDMAGLARTVDEGLLRALRTEQGSLGKMVAQEPYHARIQDTFGSPEANTSIAHRLGSFQEALESLALDPHSPINQMEVAARSEDVAGAFRQSSTSIQEMRREADGRIADTVDQINGLTREIADLNAKIVRNQHSGHNVGDLQDARDTALDQLSSLIDIRSYARDDGEMIVFTTSGLTLVDETATMLSHTPVSSMAADTLYADGDVAGIYAGEPIPGNDITTKIQSGALAGLIELRDRTLPDLQAGLDRLASSMRDTVNQAHNRSVAHPGLTEATGSRRFADPGLTEITFAGTADTRLVLFDDAGQALDTTTVRAEIGGATATVDDVATALDGWLSAGGYGSAAMTADGRLSIMLNDGYRFALRDEAAVDTVGSAAADAAIGVDVDGNATIDQTVAGFSSFFGLNDLFVDQTDGGTVGAAGSIALRPDIAEAPDRIARGTVQWTAGAGLAGAYQLGVGDATGIRGLADAFAAGTTFAAAGRLPAVKTTFTDYGATVVARSASDAEAASGRQQTQSLLVESLRHKADSISGVNLDEELADLIRFEQGYAAAAQVIGTIRSMFQALENVLG